MDDDGVEGGLGMVTATTWVPRGFAAQFPTRKEFDEEEFARIAGLARGQLDDAKEDLDIAEKGGDVDEDEEDSEEETKTKEGTDGGVAVGGGATEEMEIDESAAEDKKKKKEVDDDDLKEYDLDNYDNDDDEIVYGSDADGEGQSMGMFNSIKSLAYHQPGEKDPYITLEEDEDEEKEELQVLATDNLLLVAKTEDEVSHLEVYVYEDESDNLYVHHDIMLPAVPLCVEWLDLPVGTTTNPNTNPDARGNFCAIGTMDPDIEVWDLDVVDCMYPNAILGAGGASGGAGDDDGKKKKKKKKKSASKKANDTHHVDAVIALAANRSHRNLLASGSADKTIKLWDLNTATCAKSYSYHTDKVCALAWHPKQTTVLLSGSWDRTVVASDMRAPDAKVPRWGVESDVETIRWDPHDSNYFYVTTESGMVHFHDIRNTPAGGNLAKTKPVWTLQAHHKACSAFDVSPHIPGLIATGSGDKTVKLWTIGTSDPGAGNVGPSMVVSRDLDVGQVFSVGWAPDKEVGFRLSVGGSKGLVRVWDTSTNAAVRRVFAGRVPMAEGDVVERLVGVESDSDDDEDGDEGEAEEEEEEEEEQVDTGKKSKSKKKKGDEGWESMDEE